MAVLEPKLALLDETDSGLDIDALQRRRRTASTALRVPDRAIVLVTHYQRLLDYIEPGSVHVLSDGASLRSGDKTLALELEQRGYDWVSRRRRWHERRASNRSACERYRRRRSMRACARRRRPDVHRASRGVCALPAARLSGGSARKLEVHEPAPARKRRVRAGLEPVHRLLRCPAASSLNR